MTRAATALLLVLALAACGTSGHTAAPPPTPSATSESPTPSASQAPSPSASPTPTATPSRTALPTDLADGTTYVYAKSIDTAARTVTIDVVQFLTGEAAQKAAHEDGKEADNDYYIRNQNTKLRTVTFAAALPIVVNTLTADETGDSTKDTPITVAKFAAYFDTGDAQQRLYILTVKQGVVTKIHEQYLP